MANFRLPTDIRAAALDFAQRRRISLSSNSAPMVSKCANPGCRTDFKYFSEGRIYEFTVGGPDGCKASTLPPAKGQTRELFWLCQDCAQQFTLDCSSGEIRVVGREHRAA